MKRIVKILKVVDTRKYEEGDDDKWHAIAGSGIEHECDRCGKLHEVHATVLLEDGLQVIVGTGCMAQEDAEMAAKFQSLDRAAKRLSELQARRARVLEQLEKWSKGYLEVCNLPLPEVTIVQIAEKRYAAHMGDANVWLLEERLINPERLECLTDSWRLNRMVERGFDRWKTGRHMIYEVAEFDKQIAKVEKRMVE